MSKYIITFARSARKELEALDGKIVDRVFPKIENLSKEPRPTGCRKLTGNKHLWRIRVGDYRKNIGTLPIFPYFCCQQIDLSAFVANDLSAFSVLVEL